MSTSVTSPTSSTPPVSSSSSSSSSSSTGTTGTQTDIDSGASSLSSSYSTFLTLLTTQLKNQDPTSPMDTNAFTQQLVSMTGVQQQLLSNQLLQTLVNQSGSSQGLSSGVDLIGKTVTAASSSATLSGGQAGWSYNLGGAASAANLTVTNASGTVVYSGAAPDLSSGTHAFTWNGKSTNGTQLPDGDSYTLSIAASDASGAAVTATPMITGKVTSVQSVNGVATLSIGASQAPLSTLTSVTGA